jgi:undecaprenyl-diphosphatase
MAVPALWETLLLGLLQGLTEFLPISCSGHLVLAQALLGVEVPGVVLEVILHAGTLVAVLAYYWKDLVWLARGLVRFLVTGASEGQRETRYILLLAIGTVPVLVAGLTLRESVEAAFQSPRVAAAFLICTGLLLLSTRFYGRGGGEVRPASALWMGIFQAISLLPGVSRSGATISAGLMARIVPREAARFSFLLSVPAILGALVVNLPDVAGETAGAAWGPYLAGFLAAAVSGYAAISILLRVLGRGHLAPFGYYCVIVGLIGVIFL